MPKEPEIPRETGGSLKSSPEAQITALRERVAFLKEQARLLLKRFEKREISPLEARTEAERLAREVGEAERQLEQMEPQRRNRN
jgi:hypothetical protein